MLSSEVMLLIIKNRVVDVQNYNKITVFNITIWLELKEHRIELLFLYFKIQSKLKDNCPQIFLRYFFEPEADLK